MIVIKFLNRSSFENFRFTFYLAKKIKFIFNQNNISFKMQNQQFIFITKYFSVLCLFQDPLFLFVLSYLDIPIFFQKPILVLATFFFLVFSIFFPLWCESFSQEDFKMVVMFRGDFILFIYFGFSIKLPELTVNIFNESARGKNHFLFNFFFRLFKIGLIFQSNCETRWQRAKWRKGRFKIRLVNKKNNAYKNIRTNRIISNRCYFSCSFIL